MCMCVATPWSLCFSTRSDPSENMIKVEKTEDKTKQTKKEENSKQLVHIELDNV